MYHCTKTYYKQQTEAIKHQDNYSTEYDIITWPDIVKLIKRNKKCEVCYNNFARWKIETIVDVMYQKQPRGVLKTFRDIR